LLDRNRVKHHLVSVLEGVADPVLAVEGEVEGDLVSEVKGEAPVDLV
jgi:hypothetical protein